MPQRDITQPRRGKGGKLPVTRTLDWARTLDKEECALDRSEYSLKGRKVTMFFAYRLPSDITDTLAQVTSMKETIDFAGRSRTGAGVPVPRSR